MLGVAFIHFLQGRLEAAARGAEEALRIAREVNAFWRYGWAHCILALVAALSGDSATALEHGEWSVQAQGETHSRAHTHWGYALVQCGVNNQEVAWQHLRMAYHTAQVPSSVLRVLAVAAVLLGQQGKQERAIEVLGAVFSSPYSAHAWMEQWWPLTEMRAYLQSKLGATTYQSLFERGASLNVKALADDLLGRSSRVGVTG
jgi:hypothetical protein